MLCGMEDIDIHIGDVLRIRSWEDMITEFEVDEDEEILYDGVWFLTDMRGLCGRIFTVSNIEGDDEMGYDYQSVQGVEQIDKDATWSIRAWMLEPYEDDEDFECATDDEITLLFS